MAKPRPKGRRGLALACVLVATSLLAGAAIPAAGDGPDLIVDRSVDAGLSSLAQDTWRLFVATFRGRKGCIGAVRLRASTSLGSRGAYDPATATVTVRVPASAAMLQSALVHEWAHHVEYRCAAHQELRPAFLAAQGLPVDTPWRPDAPHANASAGPWAEVPSEQYAEAAVVAVLATRSMPTRARLSPQAVAAVARWAASVTDPAPADY